MACQLSLWRTKTSENPIRNDKRPRKNIDIRRKKKKKEKCIHIIPNIIDRYTVAVQNPFIEK